MNLTRRNFLRSIGLASAGAIATNVITVKPPEELPAQTSNPTKGDDYVVLKIHKSMIKTLHAETRPEILTARLEFIVPANERNGFFEFVQQFMASQSQAAINENL